MLGCVERPLQKRHAPGHNGQIDAMAPKTAPSGALHRNHRHMPHKDIRGPNVKSGPPTLASLYLEDIATVQIKSMHMGSSPHKTPNRACPCVIRRIWRALVRVSFRRGEEYSEPSARTHRLAPWV